MRSGNLEDGICMGKEADDSVTDASEMCSSPQTQSSIDKYNAEWEKLRSEGREALASRSLHGELRAARLRSVAWRLLLGLLKSDDWSSDVAAHRNEYRSLKMSLLVDPRLRCDPPPSLDNPLSQHDQSSWHQYFCDGELRCVIMQDVRRTFPGLDFFRSDQVQTIMVNILFCYARHNPIMCYRQGMHEILAPILFVLSSDHQALLHLQQQTLVNPDIMELVNPDYLEEDGYTLFKRIMESVEGSYMISDMIPLSTGHFPAKQVSSCPGGVGGNQAIIQLKWIKQNILAPTDPQLSHHLDHLDISLPLFAIRWLRLMFGREFPLEDLLVLWDSIFAFDSSFDLVNYIVVAMLYAIRTTLLTCDYTACLSLLMRYPSTMDISYIVDYALHLSSPQKYPVPKCSGYTELKQQPRNTNVVSEVRPVKKTSHKPLPLTSNIQSAPIEGKDIIEGYSLNDPVVLEGELENCRRVMTLCRMKLGQYLSVLDPAVPAEDRAAHQALAGIHQISSLLDAACIKEPPVVIEVAAEAAAAESPPAMTKLRKPQPRPKSSVDMTVFKQPSLSSPTSDLPKGYPALTPTS